MIRGTCMEYARLKRMKSRRLGVVHDDSKCVMYEYAPPPTPMKELEGCLAIVEESDS